MRGQNRDPAPNVGPGIKGIREYRIALPGGLAPRRTPTRRDLLPFGPAAAIRVLVVHSGSGAWMVAGARRSWSALRSRAPADRRCAASGVRPRWAECGRTWL